MLYGRYSTVHIVRYMRECELCTYANEPELCGAHLGARKIQRDLFFICRRIILFGAAPGFLFLFAVLFYLAHLGARKIGSPDEGRLARDCQRLRRALRSISSNNNKFLTGGKDRQKPVPVPVRCLCGACAVPVRCQ